MITLSKSGNTVTFTFDENSGYLQNGTIDVPVNSLSLIIDESDMATFRKSASNDIFVSALYSDFGMSKSELEAWYKANMVGSSGGGGGGVTPEEVQGMIDESISGLAESSAVTEEISEAVSGKADSVSAVSSAEYVSSSTTIDFKNADGDVISSIDASDFVIDGMIDDVRIETISGASYLVIDFNTASGKEDIQIPLTDIFDPSNYYTKSEVDDAISAATDDMATQTWVGEQGYLTEHQSLSAYSTTEEMNTAIEEATSGKADTSAVTAVNNVLTAHTADTTIHVTSADKTAWNAKSDFSGSYNDLTDKPTIPTVPTSNTAFTNDAGYATSGYVDSAVSGKQDTLVSGTNIKTINNESILGSGNITIQGGGGVDSGTVQTMIDESISGKANSSDSTYSVDTSIGNDGIHFVTLNKDGGQINYTDEPKIIFQAPLYSDYNDGKVKISGVTAVTSASTDSEIPTAKAVYNAIPQGGGVNVVQTTGTSTTDVMSQDAVTTQLNNKANKSAAFGGYSFGSINNVDFLQYRNVSNSNIGNSIFYPKINGKSILTNNQIFAQNNYNFQLVETSAITSSVTSASTDSQVPSAKAVYDALGSAGGAVSSAITSGDTNAVAGGAVYDKFDEVEQVTAAGLNALNDKFGGLKLVKITQTDYNNLQVKDANTLYVIVN